MAKKATKKAPAKKATAKKSVKVRDLAPKKEPTGGKIVGKIPLAGGSPAGGCICQVCGRFIGECGGRHPGQDGFMDLDGVKTGF